MLRNRMCWKSAQLRRAITLNELVFEEAVRESF